MPHPKQLSIFKDPRKNTKLWWIVKQNVYGGSINYRKVARPFDSKMLTHVVFKANLGNTFRFTKFNSAIREIVERTASRYGVRVREVAVNHDHLHVLFYTKSREAQTRFLRLVSADIGRWYKAIRRKFSLAQKALWVHRPFTRLVSWGRRSLERVTNYIHKNHDEAMGFVAYTPRNHALTRFLTSWTRGSFSSA